MNAEKIADLRLKHLEMIQAVVNRMAGAGASLKNYCITLTTAICGVAISPKLPPLAVPTIFVFASLDAQYLRLERRFRTLFDLTRKEDWATPPSFEIHVERVPDVKLRKALMSWSIRSFYIPLALGVWAIYVILGVALGRFV